MNTPQIQCTTANIGTAPIITITNVGEATRFSLWWEFGSQIGDIANYTYLTRISDYVWPQSMYNEMPNRSTAKGNLYCDCYAGTRYLQTIVTTFTVLVNELTNSPVIALPDLTEINENVINIYTSAGENLKWIKYISTAEVIINATAKNAASIMNIHVTNGSQQGDGQTTIFNNLESRRFGVQVEDSRDFITSISYEIPAEDFVEYIKLTCNVGNENPDTRGNMRLTCSGNYFNARFGSGEATQNALTVQYRYKELNGTFGAWATMTASASGNTYSAYADVTGLDYEKRYVFECKAIDRVMEITSEETTISALPVFHWSENDFVFEVPVTFKQGADGDHLITGDLRLKGSGNYGNTLYFGDGSYCYLKEETDDNLTIKASDLNLNVSNLYLNGGAIKAGTWTPALTTAAAVSSYTTRSGWYIRVGNVVTVGFNIGASCKSGYNSTALAISGLPFTPAANAFGGGVMFGAYVNAGFCFEAWAATTSGEITPRLQPCNNTTASNLQIASTAYYPNGAYSLTLGGTITFITN